MCYFGEENDDNWRLRWQGRSRWQYLLLDLSADLSRFAVHLGIQNYEASTTWRPAKCCAGNYHNDKAWMTGFLFHEIMRRINARIQAQDLQILMVMDNVSTHHVGETYSNIELLFFHPTPRWSHSPWTRGSSAQSNAAIVDFWQICI